MIVSRIRYDDGHVKCGKDGLKWYGFLVAVCSLRHDYGCMKAQYFRRFQRARQEPVTIISNTETGKSWYGFLLVVYVMTLGV